MQRISSDVCGSILVWKMIIGNTWQITTSKVNELQRGCNSWPRLSMWSVCYVCYATVLYLVRDRSCGITDNALADDSFSRLISF